MTVLTGKTSLSLVCILIAVQVQVEWIAYSNVLAAEVAGVTLSVERGFYEAPFTVTMSTPTPDAQIHYTLDGSFPTETHGLRYTKPVRIDTTTCLCVGAFKAGWTPAPIVTHTYLFLDHILHQATDPVTGRQRVPEGYPERWVTAPGDYQVDPDVVGQNGQDLFGGKYAASIIDDLKSVPTVSLVMPRDDWFGPRGIYIHKSQDGTERVCSMEFIDPNGQTHQVNMAIAMQGGVSGSGTSLNRWIKTFKLSMRPRFKPQIDDGTPTGGPTNVEFRFFPDSPVDTYDTIVLDAVHNYSWLHSWADGSSEQRPLAMYIQDQYIADLHNAMSGQSPYGSYAHLYINGLYWGVYYLHDRPDHAWAAQMRGGDKDEYDAIKHGPGYVINNGIGGSATANYNAMLQAARAVADDPVDPAKYEALTQRLDIDSFIAYLLANWYGANHDWPGKNWYATARSPGGKWYFHSWDAEKVLNNSIPVGRSPSGIHNILDNNYEYRMRFADLIYRYFFNDGPLSYPAAAELYVTRMNQIERALVGESARWGDSRRSLPYTLEEWIDTQEDKLNHYFPDRSERVLNRLRAAGLYPDFDPPVFLINGSAQRGGHVATNTAVALSGEGDIIFYTTDGSDPWQALGGRFGPDPERVYGDPILLHQSTHIKTRSYRNETWSALNEAIFAVGPVAEQLRLTELMYHPLETGQPGDPNAEFIELQNVGTDTINLNLVRFTDGVEFTFPSVELASQQSILVVKDVNAFESYYGRGHSIAGQYAGRLNNAGEHIELQDAAGQIIHAFEFKDGWYDSTDGEGYSLVVGDPIRTNTSDWNSKETWRPSLIIGGSPGSMN